MKNLSGLSFKYMRQNKQRTLMTILGVVLSAMLVFTIFSGSISVYNSIVENKLRQQYGWEALFVMNVEDACKLLSHVEYYDTHPDSIGGITDDEERNLPELESGWMLGHERYATCQSINDINAMPIKPELTKGTYPQSANGMIISSENASDFKLSVGDKYEDTTTTLNEKTGEWEMLEEGRTVCGIYSSLGYGMDTYNQDFPSDACYLSGFEYINIMSDDLFVPENNVYLQRDADDVEQEYTNRYTVYVTFGDKHNIVSQAEQIAEIFGIDNEDYLVSDAALERYYKENSKEPTSYALFSLILIVVGALTAVAIIFIVRNSFNISVHERNRDYGILRCIGLTRRQIIHMILYEALSVGIMGTALGILVGYGFCRLAFYNIGKYFDYLGGYSVAPISVLWTVVCMLVATGYAMIGPIQKLYSLNPIEALRRSDEVNSVRKEPGKKEKSNKKNLKQIKRTDRLTKHFGIEAGYAYRNLMRTRSRFLLVAVTLTIGGSFYIGGSTFSKLLSVEMNSYASDDYTGFFNCWDEAEFNTIKLDLSSLNCVSNGNGKAEITFDWTTQEDAADSGNTSPYETGNNAAYFIGLEETDYEQLLSECEKLGLKINARSNALNVIEVENSVEDDFSIPFKAGYEFNVQAVLGKEEFKNLAADVDYSFWEEEYLYGQPIYVYPLDDGFETLFEAGLSENLYTSNVQSNYTYNVYVDERASDYYKFENYLNNTTHDYIDETLEIKIILKIFKLVKLAINTVIVLVLLIFFINSINIQHSQMLLRKDEFGILRVIGMSKKQLKRSLIIENMAGVVAAAFWSVVLGTIGGNVLARVLEWLNQIDDEVRDYSPVTIDIKSVIVVILLLLFLGFVSAAIASNTDENSKH